LIFVISLISNSFTLPNSRVLITSSFYEEGMYVTVVNINNLHNRHIMNDIEFFRIRIRVLSGSRVDNMDNLY
jgi:hypothetical protein